MPQITGSFTTFTAVGNKEDLTDVIHNIDPTDTPFMQAVARAKATAVLHEWQTDGLPSVDTNNARPEGDAVNRTTSTPTVRRQNYCQISSREATVSGTQRASNPAGRGDELDYQLMRQGKALRNDMEAILLSTQGQAVGDGVNVPRRLRGLESWLSTNQSRGAGGAAAVSPTTAPTDGTARAFTENFLRDVMKQCWDNGAEPTVLMVGSFNKQVASTFVGRVNSRQEVDSKAILGAASLYASDFGDLKIVPNRRQRGRTAFLLDPRYAKVAYLRPMQTTETGTIGDAETAFILAEYTLEVCNERAHGVIADLTVV